MSMAIVQPDVKAMPRDEVIRRPMSRAEFLEYVENVPSVEYGFSAEWVDGTAIIMMAPARVKHNLIAFAIGTAIQSSLPGVYVVLDGGFETANSYREPDVMAFENYPADDDAWTISEALIIAEVLSHGTWREDLGPKAAEYLAGGVSHYWTVDVEMETMTLRTNTGNDWNITGTLNAENPNVKVEIPGRGVVNLTHAELFA
jgi:Uma2 family endonuclease